MAALLLLLLLAPEQAHELKYRFEKGMKSEDATTHESKFEVIAGDTLLVDHVKIEQRILREVRKVGKDGRPSLERVTVKKFVTHVLSAVDAAKEGTKPKPSQGRTFVWRGNKLYDDSGNVTRKFPSLVSKLRNWGDARLPGKPVKVGESWEVSAATFLKTAGLAVPEGVSGKAAFTLKEVVDGIATISFRNEASYEQNKQTWSFTQEGTWRFDVRKGRDLELKMKAKIKMRGQFDGAGYARMTRAVTYSR